jgi:hypothetical protein
MRNYLIGLTAATVLGASGAAVGGASREGVPELDHVFVIVLENHNSFTSFGSNGILDNPKAPHIQALALTKAMDRCRAPTIPIPAWTCIRAPCSPVWTVTSRATSTTRS